MPLVKMDNEASAPCEGAEPPGPSDIFTFPIKSATYDGRTLLFTYDMYLPNAMEGNQHNLVNAGGRVRIAGNKLILGEDNRSMVYTKAH